MTSESMKTSLLSSGEVHGVTGKVLQKDKEKCSFIWTIENFSIFLHSMTCGNCIKSPTFPPSNRSKYQWRASLFPLGKRNSDIVGLTLDSPAAYNEFNIARACLSLRDSKHCEFDRFILDYKFDQFNDSYQTLGNLNQKPLLEKIGMDDMLEIQVEVFCVVYEARDVYPDDKKFSGLIKPDKLIEDLSAMFLGQKLGDLVINVQGTEIKAHCDIIAARSPVLAKMIQRETEDEPQIYITIDNVDPEVMQKLVLFIYTSRLEHTDTTKVKRLIDAAEYFGVEDLKNLCGDYLSENFSIGNVLDTLDYADSHSMPTLKSRALDFIYKNRNDFTDIEEYEGFFQKSRLLAEIVVRLASN